MPALDAARVAGLGQAVHRVQVMRIAAAPVGARRADTAHVTPVPPVRVTAQAAQRGTTVLARLDGQVSLPLPRGRKVPVAPTAGTKAGQHAPVRTMAGRRVLVQIVLVVLVLTVVRIVPVVLAPMGSVLVVLVLTVV